MKNGLIENCVALILLMATTIYPQARKSITAQTQTGVVRLEGATDFCVTRTSARAAYSQNRSEMLDVRDCQVCRERGLDCVDLWLRDGNAKKMQTDPTSVREEVRFALIWALGIVPVFCLDKVEPDRTDLRRWERQVPVECKNPRWP